MAKFITRTFSGTKAQILAYDVAEQKIAHMQLIVSVNADSDKLDKACAKALAETGYRFVAVESAENVSELRAMTEEEFLAHSILLDPETRKPVEE